MQEKHLFEYAVIRVVPCVEREEFMNIGVILYCSAHHFLKASFEIDEKRLLALCSETDLDELRKYLTAITEICEGKKKGGSIGKLPMASRFRWLTATRSTIVQTSPTHTGLCHHPEETLLRLMRELVHR